MESLDLVAEMRGSIIVTKGVFKTQLGISKREMLTATAVESLKDGKILYSVSVESDEFPVKEGCVRIEVKVGGYYAESFNGQCKVTCVSITDLKLNPVLTKIAKVYASTSIPVMTAKINKGMLLRGEVD